ncbi:MAG TPA: AAA family ATPase [Pyrinomonadaceae bacterium]|nr:AAA family ATPase [Pyrinomonadaceae bacterium]
MTKLTDFLAAFFQSEDETIYLRAFKAKDVPDAPHNYPLIEVVTRRAVATDEKLQNRMMAGNKSRGWYFVVNTGGNVDAEITRFNAFFLESDQLPIEEQHRCLDSAPLQPSIRLETRKSVHAYWLIKGVCDANAWRDMQERLVSHFDSDRSIKNPSRVMRLPFFNHVHYDRRTGRYEYKRIELHTFEPESCFTLAEMQMAFPLPKSISAPSDSESRNEDGAQNVIRTHMVADIVLNGSRHKELLSLAGSMRRRGMSAEEMYAALKVTNQLRCHPPLDEAEVFELCKDISQRYAPDEVIPPHNVSTKQTNGRLAWASEFKFTSLGELLAEPEENVSFVWEKTLPVGGFSICSAKPKVGKSTLGRNLALCISRGEPFLGRETVQGKVLYLCLEEKRAEVAKHFRRMNASDDNIQVAFVTPENAITALQIAIAEYEPVLTIIDPLSRVVRVRDFNDYGAMSRALEPLIDLARKTACHVLALHHDGKGEREGGDALLGSTALFGAVDCHIQMKKRERGRTILTTQRYGEDMPETVVELEAETGLVLAQGDLQTVLFEGKKEEILASMNETEELTEADLKERTGGKQGLISKAIRSLVDELKLTRNGAGKRGDPYTYRKTLTTPTNLETLINLENTTSEESTKTRLSRSVYIEEPRNLQTLETNANRWPDGQLFNASPLHIHENQMSESPQSSYSYPCWSCSTTVFSENTTCPNCEQNLNDLPF